MRVHMYMSINELHRYQGGKMAWGISKEAKRDYPYMNIHVDVPICEVLGLEPKTMPIRDKMTDLKTGMTYDFISYDVVKGGEIADGNEITEGMDEKIRVCMGGGQGTDDEG